jgi:hypothetical protein
VGLAAFRIDTAEDLLRTHVNPLHVHPGMGRLEKGFGVFQHFRAMGTVDDDGFARGRTAGQDRQGCED